MRTGRLEGENTGGTSILKGGGKKGDADCGKGRTVDSAKTVREEHGK